MALDALFTGRNDRFETKRFTMTRCSSMGSSHRELSNGKSQEVKPYFSLIFFEGVGQSRFAWFQFQSNAF